MSDHMIHIGHTEVVVMQEFGKFTLSFKELKRPYERVGSFDDPVAASRFVEALKRGLAAEDRAWDERVPGLPLPKEEEPPPSD